MSRFNGYHEAGGVEGFAKRLKQRFPKLTYVQRKAMGDRSTEDDIFDFTIGKYAGDLIWILEQLGVLK